MLLPKLLQYVPPHKYYLEVFGGGANLLFAKKPAPLEVYNDIWGILVNFFRVLRDEDKFAKFYRLVWCTPYARAEYQNCQRKLKAFIEGTESLSDIELAYCFFICARQGFAGHITEGWGYRIKAGKMVRTYFRVIEELPKIRERITYVQIENLHWKELLEKYSGYPFDEEFIYLDPPYLPETRRDKKAYVHEMSYKEHEELIEYLLTHRRRVMLSGYDNDLYRELEKHGWKKICWSVACHAAGRTRQTGILGEGATFKKEQRRTECIWINYEINGSLF